MAATSAKLGLNTHRRKTKILKTYNASTSVVTLASDALEEVEAFTYLGSVIDKLGSTDANDKARTSTARAAFIQLKKIWSSKDLMLQTKIRLLNNIKLVLLYGATVPTTTNKVQTFINTCLMKILQICLPHTISNNDPWQ